MELILIALLVFATIFMGVVAVFRRAPAQEAVTARLRDIEQDRAPRAMTLALPFHRRAVLPFLQSIAGLLTGIIPPRSIESTQRNLAMAGRRQSDPLVWIALKWAGAGVLGIIGYFAGVRNQIPTALVPFIVAGFGGLGYLLPELSLRRAIMKRQARILKEMPDTLDLLTISVEAGLGLDQAMEIVAKRRKGPIADEIRVYLDEVGLGGDRHQALKGIGTRTGLDELTSFTSAITQAMEFGVSIAQVLRIQAEEVRTRRRQRIEERAMKAPVKLLFPIIFLILPALFVAVAGPGLIRVYTEFARPAGPSVLRAPSTSVGR